MNARLDKNEAEFGAIASVSRNIFRGFAKAIILRLTLCPFGYAQDASLQTQPRCSYQYLRQRYRTVAIEV